VARLLELESKTRGAGKKSDARRKIDKGNSKDRNGGTRLERIGSSRTRKTRAVGSRVRPRIREEGTKTETPLGKEVRRRGKIGVGRARPWREPFRSRGRDGKTGSLVTRRSRVGKVDKRKRIDRANSASQIAKQSRISSKVGKAASRRCADTSGRSARSRRASTRTFR